MKWSLSIMILASLLLSVACGGTEGSSQQGAGDEESVQSESLTTEGSSQQGAGDEESVQSESLTVRSADDPAGESTTAYDMSFLDDRYEEGENPELRDDSEMYVLVDSAQEGSPFTAYVDGLEKYAFNGRTPYYIDLDEYNKYGNVGAGSVAIYNGNTDDAYSYIELHTYNGTVRSDSCSSYRCETVVSWSGPN